MPWTILNLKTISANIMNVKKHNFFRNVRNPILEINLELNDFRFCWGKNILRKLMHACDWFTKLYNGS